MGTSNSDHVAIYDASGTYFMAKQSCVDVYWHHLDSLESYYKAEKLFVRS